MPSPSSAPPVHALFDTRLKAIEQQLAQINVWIRSTGVPRTSSIPEPLETLAGLKKAVNELRAALK